MRKGAVQEEILFLIFPELFMTKAVCSKMERSEALVITGPKRYSNYTGYSHKTKFTGKHEDSQPIDELGRIGMEFLEFISLTLLDF